MNLTEISCWLEGISNNVEKYVQQEKRKHVKLDVAQKRDNHNKNAVFICGVTEKVLEGLDAL